MSCDNDTFKELCNSYNDYISTVEKIFIFDASKIVQLAQNIKEILINKYNVSNTYISTLISIACRNNGHFQDYSALCNRIDCQLFFYDREFDKNHVLYKCLREKLDWINCPLYLRMSNINHIENDDVSILERSTVRNHFDQQYGNMYFYDMFYACMYGAEKCFDVLLEKGKSGNLNNAILSRNRHIIEKCKGYGYDEKSMACAVYAHDFDMILTLHEKYPIPLMDCACCGNLKAFLFGLFNDDYPKVELNLLAAFGIAELAKTLYDKTDNLENAIKVACYFDQSHIYDMFQDIHHMPKSHLFCAAKIGCTKIVEYFLKNGFDVNSRDDNNSTLLHVSIESNNPELVDLVIKSGADIDALDGNNNSPMYNACKNEKYRAVEILKKYHPKERELTWVCGELYYK